MSSGPLRIAVVVAVIGLLAGPVAGAGFGGLAQEQVDPDTVVLQVALQADGDAQWAVSYRTRLDDDNTTAAFESLQSDIRNDSAAYTAAFSDRMTRTVATAENATGREMALRNLTVSAETEALPQEYGVVTYRFEWTNFAAVEGEQIRAGDALAGLFLDGESTLRIRWPERYERASVAPDPTRSDATSVAWDGRLDFGPEEPILVVSEAGAGQVTSDDGTNDGPGTPDGDGNAWLLLLATGLAAGGVVALLWANRRYGFTDGAGTVATPAAGETPEPSAEPEQGASADAVSERAETDDGGGEDGDGDETPPPELLSNEEQVLRLLDDEGGRVKQQQIASDLDWTAAKTSQVISGLREDEELETFRIGRENVVTLPDVDIAGDNGVDGEPESDTGDRTNDE